VLLIPFIKEIWFELLLAVAFWLVLPTLLVWQGRPKWAAFSYIIWGMMFVCLAYISFGISERTHQPSRDGPILASFMFLLWCVGALTSFVFAISLFLKSKYDNAQEVVAEGKLGF
jgi:hypothetical protein